MTPTGHYHFDPYLDARSQDWFGDDALLGRLLDELAPVADRSRLAPWGRSVAGPLRALAEESARPENAPRLLHHDAYDRRIDSIVLPASTHEALSLVAGDAVLGALQGDPFVHYAMVYLLAQNGEAGVACSVACTDGLVRALDALGDGEPHRRALKQVRDSSPGRYAHAAQFVTEIQGGSDVPANVVRAVSDGEAFRLRGQKWFCSNINADWFLVTARSDSATGTEPPVGLFLVPAFVDEASRSENRRNGYCIDRLKDKLGTRELATAEVTFDGAVAWSVGPLDRGLPNLLRYVLTPSRFACVVFAAAALRQAERIAGDYARFRHAFGRPIADYPLVARTLDRIARARAASLSGMFELLRLWQAAEADGYRGDDAVRFRILLSLAKPVWTRRATTLLHDAMMVLGGNGIEERFSTLPRLFRDCVIMETWEGPHSLLYTQALNDLVRFDVDPADFVHRVTDHPSPALVDGLAAAMAATRRGEDGTVAMADLAPWLLGVPVADTDALARS
jgi:alkylation response protein AidB-like acyl-CoA dehydrogenase